MASLEFKSKPAAVKYVESLGYVYHDKGFSGDGGYGSRLYFKKPNTPVNQYGAPLQTATVSKVGRSWMTYEFKGA